MMMRTHRSLTYSVPAQNPHCRCCRVLHAGRRHHGARRAVRRLRFDRRASWQGYVLIPLTRWELELKIHTSAAGIIFALALLSSGQSSSITATLAGQVVSEGFIEWRISVSHFTRCVQWIPLTVGTALPETVDHASHWFSTIYGGSHRRWAAWNQCTACRVSGRSFHRSAVRCVPFDLVDLIQICHEGQET